MRIRGNNIKREVKITTDYISHPDGSVLIEMGETKVICTAMIEDKVPGFLRGRETGWVTAEYSMLPGSTQDRKKRDISRGKLDGRSSEIQRLIGRSLRSVVDLSKLGERTIWIDCDVIQADGGTRTASITGGFIAMVMAMKKLVDKGELSYIPVTDYLAAISVGVVDDKVVLDLCYEEDSSAMVDMNVIMTSSGDIIEVQATGEERPFSRKEMDEMLSFAEKGILELIEIQKEYIGEGYESCFSF